MPKKIKPEVESRLVEFTDGRDRPLGVMPLREARRQLLPHRLAAALVYNPENKLYLAKRSQEKRLYPGRFDLSAMGRVLPGEAREDAARRLLRQKLGLSADRLRQVYAAPASKATGFAWVTLFSTGKIAAEPRSDNRQPSKPNDEGMFVDRAELAYLAEQFRELLTPALVFFFEAGALFPEAS